MYKRVLLAQQTDRQTDRQTETKRLFAPTFIYHYICSIFYIKYSVHHGSIIEDNEWNINWQDSYQIDILKCYRWNYFKGGGGGGPILPVVHVISIKVIKPSVHMQNIDCFGEANTCTYIVFNS